MDNNRPTDQELAAVFGYKLKGRPLTPIEAADLLSCSPVTLQDWRHDGVGPRYYKLNGRFVRYAERDILEWMVAGRRANTSQKAALQPIAA